MANAASPMLEIEILGHVHVRADGRSLDELPNPRLLVHLLLHRGRALSREQVAFDLWPESGDGQALTNLRRELHLLRRALPGADEHILVSRQTIEWSVGGNFVLDVAQFEEALEAAAKQGAGLDPAALEPTALGPTAVHPAAHDRAAGLHRAIQLYVGDLAPTIYDDWITPHRDRLRAQYRDALERLVGVLESAHEFRAAVEPARRLVALDPLDEAAYRAQIGLAAQLGDRAMGVRAYQECAEVLRRELDVDPSPETRHAYERLLAGRGRSVENGSGVAQQPRRLAAPVLPLVGRDEELATLISAAADAQRGSPRLAVVHGEPGIGKTRLIEEAVDRWTAGGHRAASTRAYAAEGSLAYAPVAAWLRSPAIRPAIDALETIWSSEVARLVPELLLERTDVQPPPPMTESWQRQRLFEALKYTVDGAHLPALLVLDDAHWADADTLEWLHFLLRSDPALPVLVVLGARTDEERTNAALVALLQDLRAAGLVRDIWLAPLREVAATQLARSVSGRPLDDEAAASLFRDTAGHPLFVVEMLRSGFAAVAATSASAAGGDIALSSPRIPPRIQSVIAARLERLPADSRHLVEVAATVGRDFTIDVVAEASDLDELALAQALDDLWQRQITREQATGSYDFAHDWIRDVAESSIPPGRRRLLHRRVAHALELTHQADLNAVAGRLAAHYDAAGMVERAIDFHERAAALEARVSAYRKALVHLDRALRLLAQVPQTADRDRRELALQMARSAPLNATLGYPAEQLELTLNRALELAEAVGGRDEAMLALNGLFSVYFVRGSIRRSAEFAQAALDRVGDDATFLSMAWMAVGGTLTSLGEIEGGLKGFEAAMEAFDPASSRPSIFGLDPAVFGGVWSSHALWLRGRWKAARARAEAAVNRAQSLEHPFLQALAHAYSAIRCQFEGDEPQMIGHAQEAQALCARYGFPYYGEWGAILEAWSERHLDPDSATRIEAALERLSSIGAQSRQPYYLQLLADAHVASGRAAAARAVLDAAVVTASANDDRWWLPEAYRAIGGLDGGEPFIERALQLALQQHSYSLAVRAAVDLARLRPERTSGLVASVAGIADGLEDSEAISPLERLASPA